MSSQKRKRDVPVLFWVSADEMELIQQKMAQFGTKNLSAYLRKMAVDGYVVQLDLPELKELVSLLRRSSNNLNQLTRRVHETGRVYDADLEDIAQRQEQLCLRVYLNNPQRCLILLKGCAYCVAQPKYSCGFAPCICGFLANFPALLICQIHPKMSRIAIALSVS